MEKGKMNKSKIFLIITAIIIALVFLIFIFVNEDKEITTYTIKLENIAESYTLETDENGILTAPKEPIKEGYIFKGWYIGNEKLEFPIKFDKDTTIEARWEEVITQNEEIKDEIETEEQVKQEEPKEEVKAENESIKNEDYNNETVKKEKEQVINVKSVKLSNSKLTLKIGQNKKITATISPSNATNKKVYWKSSNSKVAKVDQNGNITALKAGTANIIATSGGKTSSCLVTVKKEVTYSIEFKAVEDSAISQYKIYIKSSEGKYVRGIVEITTRSGKTFDEVITTSGSENMYIKTAIKNAVIKKVL